MAGGLIFLLLGGARYRLPYENGRYFDPQAAVVYHQQTAEVYLIAGIALTSVGLVLTLIWSRGRSLRAG